MSEKKIDRITTVPGQLPINQETLDILDFRSNVNKRFEQVDKQIDEFQSNVSRRFEQIDKRFDQVDKRFEQIINSIDRLTDKLDRLDENQRNFTLRMFTISITISLVGVAVAFLLIP